MSKKLHNLKWETVALEGFPASVTDNLQGFVGLEECTDYGMDKDTKKPKKKKDKEKQKKRKHTDDEVSKIPNKKVKLSNGFVVESCPKLNPSKSNEINETNKNKKTKNKKQKENKNDINNKKNKAKLGEDINQVESNLTPEDMLTWAEFKLPETILKALMEMGFKQPTKIQELTLPAAIHVTFTPSIEGALLNNVAFVADACNPSVKQRSPARAQRMLCMQYPHSEVIAFGRKVCEKSH